MLRPMLGLSEADLERQLLRKGVRRLAAGRHACADCGRTPLVGEQIHMYGKRIVCALCRPARRAAPERSEAMVGAERGHTVRLRARSA
jgi:hypothetical protein